MKKIISIFLIISLLTISINVTAFDESNKIVKNQNTQDKKIDKIQEYNYLYIKIRDLEEILIDAILTINHPSIRHILKERITSKFKMLYTSGIKKDITITGNSI